MADYFDKLFEDAPEVMEASEVADLLRVNVPAIYDGLRERRIPGFKVGKSWRILRDELKDSLRNQDLTDGDDSDPAE